ncbi:MAG: MlaD family protein, partial [Thermodesulfobacteriota bacterium]
MEGRRTEFWVGLFTLAGIALALYMVYRTGDIRWESRTGYEVVANFKNISGLDVGDTVRVAGVEVGKVERIGLKKEFARVTLVVDHDVALYEDADAQVKTHGL